MNFLLPTTGKLPDDLYFVFLGTWCSTTGYSYCLRNRERLFERDRQRSQNISHHENLIGGRHLNEVTRSHERIRFRHSMQRLD